MMPTVTSPAAQRAQEVAESTAQFVQGNPRLQLAPDGGVMGWTGIPVVYVQKKKKKKSGTRKSKAARLREEEEIEEMSSGESVAAVDDNTSTTTNGGPIWSTAGHGYDIMVRTTLPYLILLALGYQCATW